MPARLRSCSSRQPTIAIRTWADRPCSTLRAIGRLCRPADDNPRRRLIIHRLVLWNIDLTLIDVARVSRDAYAEAFRRVTGRPLVALPQLAGASDSEIFFESLALNEPPGHP